ncbi:hypothetical protein MLD38_030963 [Melastoma candidum]|uniref:Uncharacterized protein n=1 Tax=Melastoma candidum TaxID=119954 RepID=A0ACB9MPF6_9MYRT|nr:hypothetical protein MLD38_030963 [Melastoma candidum]
MSPPSSIPTRAGKFAASLVLSPITTLLFLFLDFLDAVLCLVFRVLDVFLDGAAPPCYCRGDGSSRNEVLSGSLCRRRNVFREMGLFRVVGKLIAFRKDGGGDSPGGLTRWSDCRCDSCVSWSWDNAVKRRRRVLHTVVWEPERTENSKPMKRPENVIFLHGFLSSSSLWTETVFPNLSEEGKANYRLFAVDLLGFGRSPKPHDCLYTLSDHVEAIERSVIHSKGLDSFHLVAHSMGCIIALALATKHSKSVKSITLIAPPYFSDEKDDASMTYLQMLAEKRLWPPLIFASAVMSWYEHVGRCVCFVICRNHRTWERILRAVTRKRDLHFMLIDLTRHTHHSAWHTMHNLICGGAKFGDDFLNALCSADSKICIMHGDNDSVVPIKCSKNMRTRIPHAEFIVVPRANHSMVILGREKVFTQKLECVWREHPRISSGTDDGYWG